MIEFELKAPNEIFKNKIRSLTDADAKRFFRSYKLIIFSQSTVTIGSTVTIFVTWPIFVRIVCLLPHTAIRCCKAAPATEAVGVTGACAHAPDYVTYTMPSNHIRTAVVIRTVVNCLL